MTYNLVDNHDIAELSRYSRPILLLAVNFGSIPARPSRPSSSSSPLSYGLQGKQGAGGVPRALHWILSIKAIKDHESMRTSKVDHDNPSHYYGFRKVIVLS
jgi:hypothetical protein